MRLIHLLLRYRKSKLLTHLLLLLGVEIPAVVPIGEGLTLQHRGRGVVITPHARIGARVTIYQHVTIGMADAWRPGHDGPVESKAVVVEDDAWIFPGAVILGRIERPVTVGRGTIVAANAVLTESTGEWEVWGGVPARKLADREPVRVTSSP